MCLARSLLCVVCTLRIARASRLPRLLPPSYSVKDFFFESLRICICLFYGSLLPCIRVLCKANFVCVWHAQNFSKAPIAALAALAALVASSR